MKLVIVSVGALCLFLATLCGADTTPQEKTPQAGKATDKGDVKSATSAVGTCNEGWQSIAAKVPGSKVALGLATTKEGQRRLKWSAHKAELVTQFIRKAKGPVNAKGEIEICSVVLRISTFTDSNTVSLRDLKETNNMQAGYYAIRVVIGGNDYAEGASSDWVTIRIE